MHALIIEEQAFIGCMIEDNSQRRPPIVRFPLARWRDAVAATLRRCPDLIATDVQLAGGSGIQRSHRTDLFGQPSSRPAVFITATRGGVREALMTRW